LLTLDDNLLRGVGVSREVEELFPGDVHPTCWVHYE